VKIASNKCKKTDKYTLFTLNIDPIIKQSKFVSKKWWRFYEHMQEFFHFSKGVLINFRTGGTASTQELEEGLLPPV